MKLTELYELGIKAAQEAGSFLLKNKNLEKEIFLEKGRDIKLEIDRETEILIKKYLECSNLEILGEEFGGNYDHKNNDYWVIDPLDGTSNYFRGLDQCCVSIALMNGQSSKIGIIYNFNSNELFSSYKGGGAFMNGTKITVSDIRAMEKASLTTGFPASEAINLSKISQDFSKWKKIRMFGSAALSCAYIASGRCDAYQEKGVYLWDIAAGICLVEEAGGKAAYNKIDDSRYSVNFTNGRL